MTLFRSPVALLGTYLAAAAGGVLFYSLHIPLPWMIGAMLTSAAIAMAGRGTAVPRLGRRVGQIIVGMAIGLYFTHAAAVQTIAHIDAMLGAAVLTMLFGIGLGFALARLAKVDLTMALLGSVPGGPAEMSNLAEHYGHPGAPVALSQSFRIAIIVLTIPPLMTWSGITGSDFGSLGRDGSIHYDGLVLLIALALAAGLVFTKLRIVNGWLLGAIASTAMLTAFEIHLSAIPFPMLAAGQILLGTSLGAMFDRRLLDGAGKFLATALIVTAIFIVGCAGLALLLAEMTGLPPATLILALAPGSVTEMCLTADALKLGIPIVAAFHVIRIFLIVFATPWIIAFARNWTERHRLAKLECSEAGD